MGRKKKENNTGYSVNWSFAAVGQRKKKGVRDPDRPKGNSFKYIKKKKNGGLEKTHRCVLPLSKRPSPCIRNRDHLHQSGSVSFQLCPPPHR
jgi:hypothetical protein